MGYSNLGPGADYPTRTGLRKGSSPKVLVRATKRDDRRNKPRGSGSHLMPLDPEDQFCFRMDAELAVEPGEVISHRVRGNREPLRDL